jgi:hypothetical protein
VLGCAAEIAAEGGIEGVERGWKQASDCWPTPGNTTRAGRKSGCGWQSGSRRASFARVDHSVAGVLTHADASGPPPLSWQVEGLRLQEAAAGSPTAQLSSGTRALSLRSTPQALALLARTHGWRCLYAGLSINYLKVGPAARGTFPSRPLASPHPAQLPSAQQPSTPAGSLRRGSSPLSTLALPSPPLAGGAFHSHRLHPV